MKHGPGKPQRLCTSFPEQAYLYKSSYEDHPCGFNPKYLVAQNPRFATSHCFCFG